MHEKYNTLSYNGYLYGVKGDCNIKAVHYILGDVELTALHSLVEIDADARFSILDGQLFVNYIKTYTPRGKGKVLHCGVQINVSEIDTLAFGGQAMVKHVIDEVVCDGINLFFPYTGTIVAHQYFVDEVEWGAMTHMEESVFCFREGILDIESSTIRHNDEKFITSVCWDESKRNPDTNLSEEKSIGRRWYFVDPIGSYLQNEHLMNVHINYCVSHRIEDEWLEEILSAEVPVLRCEIMQESEAGSGDFHKVSMDLVCDTIRLLDRRRLEDVYDHIQFDKYEDYPQKMMETLFVVSGILGNKCNEENLRKCIEILKLFSDKRLKVNNTEKYVDLVNEVAGHIENRRAILELLNTFL